MCKVSSDFRTCLVHGSLACDKSNHTTGTHLIQRLCKEIIMDQEIIFIILLSPEEYRMARESTLNAHYTSPVIIRQMYETLEKMGFSKGNVLEPSMGIGNFFGMMPDSMKESSSFNW